MEWTESWEALTKSITGRGNSKYRNFGTRRIMPHSRNRKMTSIAKVRKEESGRKCQLRSNKLPELR